MSNYIDEIWRDIEGYEGYYEISTYGRIRSKDRLIPNELGYNSFKKGKMMKTTLLKKGYYSVMLSKNNIQKRFEVHRLVGLNFISKDAECFNHINGIKTDNRISNLEAVTYSENSNHAIDILNKHSRALRVEIVENNSINTFGSMAKAETYLGKNRYWMKSMKNKYGEIFNYEDKTIKIIKRKN